MLRKIIISLNIKREDFAFESIIPVIDWNLLVLVANFYRLAYFKAAYQLFDADYYVKADDDIYLRPGAFKLL